MVRPIQLTLTLMKPDVVANPHIVKEIKDIILRNGFFFAKSKVLKLSKADAGEFYAEHKGKFFYPRLVNYMSSGKISAHILARDDAISCWRQVMGPTKVFNTIYSSPNSVRGRYGLSDTRNAVHGADGVKSAEREIGFYFPEFDVEKWYKEEADYFARRLVSYDEEACCHHALK